MKRADLIIVGGGMAAARLVQRLGALGYPGQVTVICEESQFGYNRVLLPGYVGGECEWHELAVGAVEQQLNLVVHTNSRALAVDVERKTVILPTSELGYEQLVFATGSRVPAPACLANVRGSNKLVLRSIADAERLKLLCKDTGEAIVLGAGLLGLEAANALLGLGMSVKLVHRNPRVLNRQLDSQGSGLLQNQLEAKGFEFYLNRQIASAELDSNDRIRAVVLDQGERLTSDVLLLATGSTPNTEMARSAGIECRHGIAIDAHLQTSSAGHYAIGECAEFSGETCGLVAPTHIQADVLAENLCGGTARYLPPALATRLKVSGIELFSAGDLSNGGDEVCINSSDHSIYRRLRFEGETLSGAVLLGDIAGARSIEEKIGQVVSEPREREQLVFGL